MSFADLWSVWQWHKQLIQSWLVTATARPHGQLIDDCVLLGELLKQLCTETWSLMTYVDYGNFDSSCVSNMALLWRTCSNPTMHRAYLSLVVATWRYRLYCVICAYLTPSDKPGNQRNRYARQKLCLPVSLVARTQRRDVVSKAFIFCIRSNMYIFASRVINYTSILRIYPGNDNK